MEYRVEISAQATLDAEEVVERISRQYPRMAARWKAGLIEAIEALNLFPERFPLAPEAAAFHEEIRQQFHGKRRNKYRILFTIHGDTVRVLRILHGARRSLNPGGD
jgi:plasmid stabilization system protein ParE